MAAIATAATLSLPFSLFRCSKLNTRKKAQSNWFKKLLEAWKEAKPPPRTPEDASRLVIDTLKRHQKADVERLLAYYGLPLPNELVKVSTGVPVSASAGVKFELNTLPVDEKAVADGDTITVYVSTNDPRESSCVPKEVQLAVVQRSKARAVKNYDKADALQKKIVDSGYRVLNIQNQEVLAKKYRIRLRGIDAPESAMPYGKQAKEELTKLVQGKPLRVLVYTEDRYSRSVGDIYCNNIFVQALLAKTDGKVKVSLVTDLQEPVILHWALSKEDNEWFAPPSELLPPGSVLLEKAAETPFATVNSDDPSIQVKVLELDIEDGNFAKMPFVLLSAGNWTKDNGSDFCIDFKVKPKQKAAGDGKGTAKNLLEQTDAMESEA